MPGSSRSAALLRATSAAAGSRWVRFGFLGAAVALAVVTVVDQRVAVLAALERVAPADLVLAGAAAVANLLLAALAWRAVLSGLGSPLPVRAAARVYLVGQVGKYLPGGVWNLLAAAELARDHAVARRQTVASMLLAVLVSAVTAAGLAAALLLDLPWSMLAPLVLVGLCPPVLNGVIGVVLRITRRDPLPAQLGLRGVGRAVLWTMASWAAVGAQVAVLAIAAGAPATVATLSLSTGAYVLAWLVGTAAVVLPAGAGAREATLVVVLAPVVGLGAAVAVALLSRVLVTLADLLSAGVALFATRRWAVGPVTSP
ncbi:lysylphosphatidylglycerol synthase domain-containing protein [Pseudonocardia tropica]|uniref:Lysylphosphatidylglycerol synthase domain-containing protein n=1 Tax=Pseudonocardia tropica TaxID=681289 RepID=A0ABV1JNJ2_9PSEU